MKVLNKQIEIIEDRLNKASPKCIPYKSKKKKFYKSLQLWVLVLLSIMFDANWLAAHSVSLYSLIQLDVNVVLTVQVHFYLCRIFV